MNNSDRNLEAQIEVERLWVTTRQGKYVFFVMLPFTILIVVGLWQTAAHGLLLLWALVLTGINLFRWVVLHYYHVHKTALVDNVPKFKRLIMLGAALNGFWWVMCQVFFLDANDPVNVLVITVPTITQVVGVMLTWFTYFPAVLVVNIPATIAIDYFLLSEGGGNYIVPAIIFSVLPIISIPSSLRLAGMLNHALRLNFENAALRRESEEKSLLLETALENMGQGITMSDTDDLLRMWNRQFTALLGDGAGTVDSHARLSELLAAANPPIAISAEGSSNYRGPDGKVYEIRQSGLAHGGRVVTYTDISDLIKREQALEKAKREAEQANAAKTRFLASASHDLRQPIHALGLFFAELSDRVAAPETQGLLAQIDDSIAAINSMLNALLDVSKLDAGVVKPAIEPFALDDLFQRLQSEFQPIAAENRNQLKIRHAPLLVNTDPAMLERMLRNLIGNALRHTGHGRVLVAARRRCGSAEIQVIDTGPGIPDNQLDEIFVEFHQLHNPARDRRQGLGLGLAIVKRLAKLLNHKIRVKSRLGHGSCFCLTLPLVAEAAITLPGPEPQNAVSPLHLLEDRRLLVIDDDVAVRDGMRGLLSRWGCRVFAAADLYQALAEIDDHQLRPELAIVDYRLPGDLSGIEVARELRRRLAYPLPILIVTGDTGPERLREADASGFPLLHKPVQPAKLRSTLQYMLSKTGRD
ncbi:ATP-binding protein [Methylomonas koyamae]|uniref:hybrid sensor histidine kinase/response regulator n=1 Tax=Methylomonas koyamae TaxID=702114 RepID=UPI001129AC62|nr:ATP-binding protein [Methylomonas koyamae]TPQ29828.1 histidine kinase [Methylomonas koyamae]